MNSEIIKPKTAREVFLKRWWIYQRERFPVFVHIPLIAAFSFSAIGYSRLCRGETSFISWKYFLCCAFTNIVIFFILRVSDEHKDKIDDAAFRPYLPVPRGLISLRELKFFATVLFVASTILNLIFFPELLVLYLLMLLYLSLMRYEFFIGAWLKKHQFWYVVSHMVIIPLADIYASGFDWKLNDVSPPHGLLFFFGVSYLNGIVLEIARKIRVKETEEEGVNSYTSMLGITGAPMLWLCMLTTNFGLACFAVSYTNAPLETYYVLCGFFVLASLPAILFIIKPTAKKVKFIEGVSLLWALGMYLTIGGIPTLFKLI